MKYLLALLLSLIGSRVTAQNIIYLADETKIFGKVTDMQSNKIKFKKTDDLTEKIETRLNEKLCFAFNSAGSYTVFQKDYLSSNKEKEDFIKQVGDLSGLDIICDIDGNVIITKVTKETESQISYINDKTVLTTLPISNLCFLIRNDGTHKIFVGNQQAMPVLKANQKKINAFIQHDSDQNARSGLNAVFKTLTYEEKKHFGIIAKNKVEEFANYLETLTSDNISETSASATINFACNLFEDKAQIEVSSLSSDNRVNKIKYPIRDYLNRFRIRVTKYQKVKLESADIGYVTSFRIGTDGNYHGNVIYVQKYIGFIDNAPAYQDVTARRVDVIIKKYEKSVNGENIEAYEVVLGDVSVSETKRKM